MLYGGCCGKEDGGTDPATDPNLRSPYGFPPVAEEREEGGGLGHGREGREDVA